MPEHHSKATPIAVSIEKSDDNAGASTAPAEHSAVQLAGSPQGLQAEEVRNIATAGLSGGAGPLPHLNHIQSAFGSHDVSGVQAHSGASAALASDALGARAYTMGERVVFKGTPDLHTAAHEAAHVVQQRQGVNVPQGVGRVGDTYERSADAVADKVVKGESVESMLGDKAAPSSSAVQTLQRAVTTNFGTFDHATFKDVVKEGKKIGVDMHLKFTPNNTVNASKIAMVQAVRSIKAGVPIVMHEDDRGKMVNDGSGSAGYKIDRGHGSSNPVYGSEKTDTLENTKTSNADDGAQPDVSDFSSATYKLGFRVLKDGSWPQEDAELHDEPKLSDRGANAKQEFETTALAIKGVQKDSYYGSVRWGWETNQDGDFSKIALVKVSDARPSENFRKAVQVWNGFSIGPKIGPITSNHTSCTADLDVETTDSKTFKIASGCGFKITTVMTSSQNKIVLDQNARLKDGSSFWGLWVPQTKINNNQLTADVVSSKGFTAKTGSTVDVRSARPIGGEVLCYLKDATVTITDEARRGAWAKIIDTKGLQTTDLPAP